jgi:uncharacterized protein YqjF (DUF2071 family)
MTQRWNDLLFAHWPVASELMAGLLPEGLLADTFQGSAWLGVVPFWLDRIKIRGVPPVPGVRSFPDLNLRTYVRDEYTGTRGIYCFSPWGWRAHFITCPITGQRCGWSNDRSASFRFIAGGGSPAGR